MPFTPRKRGSLLKKATESACLAVYIIELLYITDLGYCHGSVPTPSKAFIAFINIQEASLVPLNPIQEIPNPSSSTEGQNPFDFAGIVKVFPRTEREKPTPNWALIRTRVAVKLQSRYCRAVDLPGAIVRAGKRSQHHPAQLSFRPTGSRFYRYQMVQLSLYKHWKENPVEATLKIGGTDFLELFRSLSRRENKTKEVFLRVLASLSGVTRNHWAF